MIATAQRTDDTFSADENAARWMATIVRTTSAEPLGLDSLLEQHDALAGPSAGRPVFAPCNAAKGRRRDDDGLRPSVGWLATSDRLDSPASLCATVVQLASLAVERDCEVIVISDQDVSGFERFGFRTERLAGDTESERETCLSQIREFWQCDVIL